MTQELVGLFHHLLFTLAVIELVLHLVFNRFKYMHTKSKLFWASVLFAFVGETIFRFFYIGQIHGYVSIFLLFIGNLFLIVNFIRAIRN